MTPRVKICGLSRPEDIDAANAHRPEYVGFVFFPRSKRYVTPSAALSLREHLSTDITPVGVFVDAPLDAMLATVAMGAIDAVQLHGSEDSSTVCALREHGVRTIIQAFKVRSRDDLRAAASSEADFVLLDAGMGEGAAFDWDLLKDDAPTRKIFLAGGLTPSNVNEAARMVRPFAVDVSSGVETNGLKDANKIELFIKEARRAI